MHELSETSRRILDGATLTCASLATVLTLNRIAVMVTIGAGIISMLCGAVRLYDRFKAGRSAAD